ncbi:MAG TPA: hypothetical protein VH042_08625 [Solirubrobacterales bacterium]|jgi:hypothetical protein|nr:hypothetical protein [Solirubrobacterales bacterium]
MSSDLIAWVVGITLGMTVVALGLRRNLADVTRSWLPQFGKAPKLVSATPDSFGGQRSRQLSPRQRQLVIWSFLFFGLCEAAFAVLGANDRLWHAIMAALFAIGAVVHTLRAPSSPETQ